VHDPRHISLRKQDKFTQSADLVRQLLVAYPSSLAVSNEFKELRKADAATANRIPAAEFFDATAADVAVMNELGQVLAGEDEKAMARDLFAQASALDPGNATATALAKELQSP
jgi:hypothetical protein